MSDMVANPKPLTFPLPEPDLEELLADAIQLDAREQRSRLEVIRDALVLGEVLTKARSLTGHGYWLDWLKQTGIPRQRAHERIQLWALGMTAEQVQEAGGIRQVLRLKTPHKQAPEALHQGVTVNDCARELAQAQTEVGNTKGPYYAALTRRRRAINALHKAETAVLGLTTLEAPKPFTCEFMAKDNGCQHHPDCFTCPFPDCVLSRKDMARKWLQERRDRLVLQEVERENLTPEVAAERLGVTVRTYYRMKERVREAAQ